MVIENSYGLLTMMMAYLIIFFVAWFLEATEQVFYWKRLHIWKSDGANTFTCRVPLHATDIRSYDTFYCGTTASQVYSLQYFLYRVPAVCQQPFVLPVLIRGSIFLDWITYGSYRIHIQHPVLMTNTINFCCFLFLWDNCLERHDNSWKEKKINSWENEDKGIGIK
jgi:hypothetical protein